MTAAAPAMAATMRSTHRILVSIDFLSQWSSGVDLGLDPP
jgi:hypothetical protein